MVAPISRGSPSAESAGTKLASWILLAAILAGVSLLYFPDLGDPRLVGDEWMAAEMAKESPGEILELSFVEAMDPAYSRNRPAFHLTTWGAARFVEDVELSARLPAALAGLLGVAAMFFLGREVYGPKEGALAAALLGVSHSYLWASRAALGYAPMAACLVLALFAAARGVGRAPGTGTVWWCVALAAAGLGYYFHPIMVLPGAVLFGALIVHGLRTRRWRELGFGLAAGSLVLLPAISVVGRIVWNSAGPDGGGKFLDDRGLQPVSFFANDYKTGERALEFLGPDSVTGFVVMAALALVGWVFSVRRRPFIAWACLALVAAPLAFVTSVSLGHGWAERYLLFLLVPLALLQARGLVALTAWVPGPSAVALGLAFAGGGGMAYWSATAWEEPTTLPPQDWGAVADQLLDETEGATLLIAGHTGGRLLTPSYNLLYLGRPDLMYHLADAWPRFRYTAAGEKCPIVWDASPEGFELQQVGGVLIHVQAAEEARRRLVSHPVRMWDYEGLTLILHRTPTLPGRVQLADILLALADAGAHRRDEVAMALRSLDAMVDVTEEGYVPTLGYLGRITRICEGMDPVVEGRHLFSMEDRLRELATRFESRPGIRARMEEALRSSATIGLARAKAAHAARQAGDLEAAVLHTHRAIEYGAASAEQVQGLLEELREVGRQSDAATLEDALAQSG